ncbi:phage tail sheath subtilisin-like domain-containing protein [Bartonella sp. DGB2]|uniref:phage tail sheath subtilisin-like domain-containing protein n=1 Tax=Bartonella sp. DGB2 TaxID=3388426 RepID=UPI00398FB5B6
MTDFLHGAEVIEIDDGPRPIRTVNSAVIGLIGTAPDADEQVFPLNEPVLIAGSRLKAAKLGAVGKARGTLPDAVAQIFNQIGAVIVVVRVEEDRESFAKVLGGVNEAGAYEGLDAFLAAKSKLGLEPRILCAAGFTHQRPQEEKSKKPIINPVVAKLSIIAQKLRAIAVIDGPNTTDEDAQQYAADLSSKRLYMVDPFVKVSAGDHILTLPASAAVAGLIAKIDYEKGFWWSPSNQVLNGVLGLARPVDFALGDKASRANLLNASKITTIIRENGYRLWGNRTLASETKWAFLPVVRTADMIEDSILRSHLWAIDRTITKTYFDDVCESVNAYLRDLKAQGAILGGKCIANPELNRPASLADGVVWFDIDFTPPTPAEHIVFRSRLTNDYFEGVF